MMESDKRFELYALEAAARGNQLAFDTAAVRLGLEEARSLVRSSGVLRQVDRVAEPGLETPTLTVALPAGVYRAGDLEEEQGDGTLLHGHFSVFNRWYEVDSWFEGNFLERVAPGSFKKTIRENREDIKALFQHGHDNQVGNKPLGPIREIKEDDVGAYYEVDLLDAPYVRDDIMPGLRAGLYGSSFRFQVMREEFDNEPDASDDNPKGLPERTLKELRLFEFGPVTFPANPAATAGVRSQATPSEQDAGQPAHLTVVENSTASDAGTVVHLPKAERRGSEYGHLRDRKEFLAWIART